SNWSAELLLREALSEPCPQAADALIGDGLVDQLLLTVSMSAFAPMPQALLIAHSPRPEMMGALQAGLAACWGGDLLEQDGVPLTVLGDGGDLPVVVAQVDGLSIFATDPNLVRAAVRLARGAAEASLADAPMGQNLALLPAGGLHV